MISKDELFEVKEKRKTNSYYEEKEYFQYIFLNAVSKYGEDIVFKGGTCLRICYGLERASEDLDFSSSFNLGEIREIIGKCLKDFESLNIAHLEPIEKEFEGNIRFEIRFKGPLYSGNPHSTNTLKIDFNKNKVRNKTAKVVQKLFSDVPAFTIVALAEKEILAEKIRSLINRRLARDLYDLWILLQNKAEFDKKLILDKLKEENSKLSGLKFPSKEEYETDLKNLLSYLPSYEQVRKEVEKALKALEK